MTNIEDLGRKTQTMLGETHREHLAVAVKDTSSRSRQHAGPFEPTGGALFPLVDADLLKIERSAPDRCKAKH